MLFNWFRRRSKPPANAHANVELTTALDDPRPASDFMPPAEAEAPPVSPPAAASAADLAALHEQLSGLVGERVQSLLSSLPPRGDHQDVRQLLDQLAHSEEGTIRPIPTAAKRAMMLARNPQANLNEVADAFERDPSLAEGLLRLANSSWYSRDDEQVGSLRDALQRIGSSGAETVIMEHALKGTLCRPGGAYDSLVAQVWTHLSRTAPIARSLAGTFGVDPDTAFMLGLLHDAGKLVLFDALSESRHRLHHAVHIPLPILRAILRELHEPLGGLAMLRWGLDVEWAKAVADHHRRGAGHAANVAAELLFVAERADLALAGGTPCDIAAWIEAGRLLMGPGTLQLALDRASDGALRFQDSPDMDFRLAA